MTITSESRKVVRDIGAPAATCRPKKIAERVAGEIVRDIVAGGVAIGGHLPLESEMIGRYRASRSSVREALRLLEVQGVLRLKPGPGGGPVVNQVDPGRLANTTSLYLHLGGATYDAVLRTQSILEPLCAQLASRNPNREVPMARFITPPTLRTPADFERNASAFHDAVHRLADNPLITMFSQTVERLGVDAIGGSADHFEERQTILREHATIARAIVAGDTPGAGSLMRNHVAAQHKRLRHNEPQRVNSVIEWR